MRYCKEALKDAAQGKLSKKIIIDGEQYTFRIEGGDDHKYMVHCIETGYCIEDNNYRAIKYLQKNPQVWEWCGNEFFE